MSYKIQSSRTIAPSYYWYTCQTNSYSLIIVNNCDVQDSLQSWKKRQTKLYFQPHQIMNSLLI